MGPYVREIAIDLSNAVRTVRRHAGFSALVVLTLSLGIGAATAVFSVVDAVLLRPPSYPMADRLVEFNIPDRGSPGLDIERREAWVEAGSGLVERWAAFTSLTFSRVDGRIAERIMALAVTPGIDQLTGTGLLMGRSFSDEDFRSGAPVALVTERYWNRLGRNPQVLGSTIRLDTESVTVVGILAGGKKVPDYGDGQDLWLPIQQDMTAAGVGIQRFHGVWGRLQVGLTLAAAQERANQIAESLQEATPREEGWNVALEPVGGFRANADSRNALWLLFGVAALILAASFLNGANLMGMRVMTRSREVSVRAAVGASRGRLLRQMLLEGLLLGLLAGITSVGLAWLSFRASEGLIPSDITYFSIHVLGVEERTLTFAFFVSLAAGTVLGLLPGLTAVQQSLRAAMGIGQGTGGNDSPALRRMRNGLVIGQVALSTVLLVGSVLFTTSFIRLVTVDPGFEHERLTHGILGLSPTSFPEIEDRAELVDRLERELEARAGVEGVTITGGPSSYVGPVETDAGTVRDGQRLILPSKRVATDYVAVTGTELVRGRGFRRSDNGRNVAIVDRDLALLLWGTDDVVGRRFRPGDESWLEVVGIARDLRLWGRNEGDRPHQLLVPRPPRAWTYLEIHARARPDLQPSSLLPVMRSALASVDREQTFFRLRTADAALAEQEETTRFLALLMAILGGIAVIMAAVGVFAVLGYSVRRREHELGIRKALGAEPGEIRRLVLSAGLRIGGIGVFFGTALAFLLAGQAGELLFDVSPRDPRLFMGAALFFLTVVTAASLIPARRATYLDPLKVMRTE